MNGQYYIVICADDKDEAIEKAMDALQDFRQNGGGAYSESRGGGAFYRNNPVERMNQREREAYEMGLRDSMSPHEWEVYQMGKRDAYGRNGAENHRNRENF